MDRPGLYIHIPFCRSKCPYCDFYSSTSLDLLPSFLDALMKEMEVYRSRFRRFDTIYLGGGTPSVLTPEQAATILAGAQALFSFAAATEITMEANPADVDLNRLKALREAGVNRINLGVQSFDEGVLKLLGRRHDAAQAEAALHAAEKAGFDNIGLDLIYGAPGQTKEAWLDTLRRAIAFHPAHLSCYQLTLSPRTPLGRRAAEGQIIMPEDESLADLFFLTSHTLQEAGYSHYEVSNFARGDAARSRHNQKYWRHAPYLALGPAAHSFDGERRWWNRPSLPGYIEALASGSVPVEASEIPAGEELQLESLFLGLRTKDGIDLSEYRRRCGVDLLEEKAAAIGALERRGLLIRDKGRLRPTLSGMAVADSLALI